MYREGKTGKSFKIKIERKIEKRRIMKKLKLLLVMFIGLFLISGCSKNEFTVLFKDGETTVSSVVVKKEALVEKPQDLIKEGYDFIGWYLDDQKYDFSIPVVSDLTLIAKWDLKTFTVKFVTETETEVKVKYNEKLEKITDPVKVGYEFIGWYDGDNIFDFNTPITKDVKLVAKFVVKQVSVKFVVDEKVINTIKVNYNETIKNIINEPTKEGYEFIGWYDGENLFSFDTLITKDLELVAKYSIQKFNVKIVVEGNEILNSKVDYNGKITAPTDPVKEGHQFDGWYVGDEKFDFNTPITKETVIIAKFTPNQYKVKFIADGVEIATVDVSHGSKAVAPTAPDKEGFVFSKWDKDISSVTSDMEVNAIYEVKKCTVKFIVDEKVIKEEKIDYNAAVVYPADPSKAGYTFTGWDKEVKEVKEDVEIIATFTIIKYSIKYYDSANELSYPEQSEYTIEDSFYLPTFNVNLSKFMGWFTNQDFTGDALCQISQGMTGDLVLYALNVVMEYNEGVECWDTTPFTSETDAAKGIDTITTLPKIFEQDFYKYLIDNDLLSSTKVNEKLRVTNFEEFSGDNKLHNNDPRKIWNDTSSNASGTADGYANFFFDKIVVRNDYTVESVEGGIFGTEPYKTKYFALLNTLVAMYKYKEANSRYENINAGTPQVKAFLAFIVDGYFYGTQGVAKDYFKSLRMVVPSMTTAYKIDGSSCKAFEVNQNAITDPVKVGYTFDGYYLDKECTKKLGTEPTKRLCTIYVKWVEVK